MSKMKEILLGSVAALSLTMPFAAPAGAIIQDKPTTIDGIRAVCTGIGESKNDPRWSSYPVKLIFANQKGQYTAGENVDIAKNGKEIIETRCDAPWLLLKPSAGKYRVTATLSGTNGERRTSADFSTPNKGRRTTVTLDFPAAQAG